MNTAIVSYVKRNVYIYIRFSSAAQSAGDSFVARWRRAGRAGRRPHFHREQQQHVPRHRAEGRGVELRLAADASGLAMCRSLRRCLPGGVVRRQWPEGAWAVVLPPAISTQKQDGGLLPP